MVTPRGKHQKHFAQRVHGVVQHHVTQFFSQGGATRLAGQHHLALGLGKGIGHGLHMAGFACAVYAFKADENPAVHAAYCALAGLRW